MADRQLVYAPSGDPLALYTFDNVSGSTIYDDIGSNNLTMSDAARTTIVSGGRISNCVSHTGSDGSAYLDLASNVVSWGSVSMWVKFPTVGTKTYVGIYGTSNYFFSRNSSNVIVIGPSTSTGHSTADSAWHHVVLTHNVATHSLKLYIDNVLIGTYSSSSWGIDDLTAFGNKENLTNYQTPNLDIVQVYSQVLDATDVETLYYLDGMQFEIPFLEIEAAGNVDISAINTIEIPFLSIAATGSLNISAEANISLPFLTADFVTGLSGNASIELPFLQVSAHGGGLASLDIPFWEFSFTGHTGIPADLAFSLPFLDVEFGGYSSIGGSASIVLPLLGAVFIGVNGSKADIAIELPFLIFDANGQLGGSIGINLPIFDFEAISTNRAAYAALSYVRGQIQ